MQNILKNMPENVRLVLGSSLPFVIVLILFAIAGNFGIAKVRDIMNSVTKAQNDQNVLTQKLNILTNVNTEIAGGSDASIVALPDANPSLSLISQIKLLASAEGLSVVSVKGGGTVEDSSGLKRSDTTIEVQGGLKQLFTLLGKVSGIAPIALVDKVKMNEAGGGGRANISLKSYYAPLPKTLPALDQSISDLSAAEKKTLSEILVLKQPLFVNIPAAIGAGKADPFTP